MTKDYNEAIVELAKVLSMIRFNSRICMLNCSDEYAELRGAEKFTAILYDRNIKDVYRDVCRIADESDKASETTE